MFRRWMTAALLALTLSAGSLQPAAAATEPTQPPPATQAEKPAAPAPAPEFGFFADLPATHWAQPQVEKLVKAGVVSWTPEALFRPEEPVLRGELFKMVLIARRIDTGGKCRARFQDVPCEAWYAPYVEHAFQMAIAEGVGGDLAAPEQPVTREQLFTIIIRALGKRWAAHQQSWSEINEALAPYTDRNQIDYYAKPPLALALKEGILAGYTDATLRPKQVATRAEAAALISRVILDAEELQSVQVDGQTIWFRSSMDLVASKYTTGEPGVGNITYTGVTVRHGAVAVDPNVIPLGTLLYVEGYGYAVAVDIGGAIKGNRIDLFSWEPHEVALTFGLQPRKVWLLP